MSKHLRDHSMPFKVCVQPLDGNSNYKLECGAKPLDGNSNYSHWTWVTLDELAHHQPPSSSVKEDQPNPAETYPEDQEAVMEPVTKEEPDQEAVTKEEPDQEAVTAVKEEPEGVAPDVVDEEPDEEVVDDGYGIWSPSPPPKEEPPMQEPVVKLKGLIALSMPAQVALGNTAGSSDGDRSDKPASSGGATARGNTLNTIFRSGLWVIHSRIIHCARIDS